MKRHLPQPFYVFCLILSVCFFTSSQVVAETTPTKIVLGTATKGGGFQLFGKHFIEAINALDNSLKIEERTTKGSKENVPLLEKGEIDIGQVEGNAAYEVLEGIGREKADLKVISVMYPNPGMFVVRGNTTYKSIEDLKGQPIAFGTKASGLRILANDVLDGIGLSPTKDFQQVILSKAAEGPAMVLDKSVEALWGAGIGWPGFVKVAKSPEGGRFIAPTAAQLEEILTKHPHLKKMSVPAGTYKGQAQQIDSVGLWSLIMAKPGLSDEVVYELSRAIHKAETDLGNRLKQAKFTNAKNTIAQVPFEQLHPGAVKYFREVGLMK